MFTLLLALATPPVVPMEFPMTSKELLRDLREAGLEGDELLNWDCGVEGTASCIGVLLESKSGEATALWVTEGLCEQSQACIAGHPIALRADFSWGTKGDSWASRADVQLGDGATLVPVGSLYLTESPGLGVMAWSAPNGDAGWRAWRPAEITPLAHPGAGQIPRFQGAAVKTLLSSAEFALSQANRRTVQGGEWDHRPALGTTLGSISVLSRTLEGRRETADLQSSQRALEQQAIGLLSAMASLGADHRKQSLAER